MVCAGGGGRAGVPAAIPATCVPWNDACGSTCEAGAVVAPCADEGAGDDHLRRRPLRAALGKPARIAVTLGIEEHVGLVDAVVDDGDLHPFAAGSPPAAASAPAPIRPGLRFERERVAVARIELAREERASPPSPAVWRAARRPSRSGATCSCARPWRSGSPASARRPPRAAPAGAWRRRPWRRGSATFSLGVALCRRACERGRRAAGRPSVRMTGDAALAVSGRDRDLGRPGRGGSDLSHRAARSAGRQQQQPTWRPAPRRVREIRRGGARTAE